MSSGVTPEYRKDWHSFLVSLLIAGLICKPVGFYIELSNLKRPILMQFAK
jgi:hypothetical protein